MPLESFMYSWSAACSRVSYWCKYVLLVCVKCVSLIEDKESLGDCSAASVHLCASAPLHHFGNQLPSTSWGCFGDGYGQFTATKGKLLDIILRDLTLSFTTISGPVSGGSSVVKSLCLADKEKHLVTAVPLINVPDVSVCPVLHLLLSAKACKAKASFKHFASRAPDTLEDCGEAFYIDKAWIGQMETKNIFMTASLDPAAVPLDFREVVPKHTFMINGKPKDDYMEVVNAVKAALNMEYRANRQLQSDGVHELVASRSVLWADTTIISTRETHLVTLRAEDAEHLSVLKTSLATMLEDKLGLRMEAPYPEIICSALSFLKTFGEEVEYKKTLLRDADDLRREPDDIKAAALLECDMQMSTDRHFLSFLTKLSSTDCV